MRTRLHWLGLAVAAATVFAPGVEAQGGAVAPAAAMAVADTGRMMPGHVDFSRYTTPGDCLAAAWLVMTYGATMAPATARDEPFRN